MNRTAIGMLVLVALLPAATATPVSSCGAQEVCAQKEVSSILNVIAAGNIQSYAHFDNVALLGDVGGLSYTLTAPAITGTPAITYTVSQLVGCTQGVTTTQQSVGAASDFSFDTSFTLTDTTCTGQLRVNLQGGLVATEVWDHLVRFTILALGNIDAQTRFCDASTFGAACNNPEINNQNRECVASTFTAACGTTAFESALGLEWGELFVIIAASLALMVLGTSVRQPIVRFGAALLQLFLGIMLLQTTQKPAVALLAGTLLLIAALIFLQVALEWTRKGKQKKGLFE